MKRALPWDFQVDISSDESSSSELEMEQNENGFDVEQLIKAVKIDAPVEDMTDEEVLFKRAEMYQEYMNKIPIPTLRGSVIPCTTWMGLGKSVKELYSQPLHYLTNILLKQWDQLRIGTADEHMPLDSIIHPCKAEAAIWLVEETHRRASSHYQLTKFWRSDPMHQAFVDSIFPQL